MPPPHPVGRLSGRRAIVTGAASGIGQATAVRFAAEGAHVWAVDLSAEGLAATATALSAEAEGSITTHILDVSDETAVGATIATAAEAMKGLDAVANIAGVLMATPTEDATLDDWERIIRINLTGTFLVCRAAIPHLIESRGCIVNAASTASFFGHPWMSAYAASKGGIEALTHSLAVEYVKQGVRVNAVAPGSIRTPLTHALDLPADADFDLLRRIMAPAGVGRPEHVAGVVAMLISDDGGFITGETIRIDGGTHA